MHLFSPTKLHCLEPKAHMTVLGNKQKREWGFGDRRSNTWVHKSAGEDGAGRLLAVGRSRDIMADGAGEMGEAAAWRVLK